MINGAQNTVSGALKVLITGATSGVGEATAKLFSERGAEVSLFGRRDSELRRVASEISGVAHTFVVDVSQEDTVSLAVNKAATTMGGLDVVVNAAGIAEFSLLDDLSVDIWNRVISTNLSGTYFVSRSAALLMKKAGHGSIVNVASDLATFGVTGLAHYSASKAGVVGLTKAMAVELSPTVRVNVVCPGPIDTPMLRLGMEQEENPEQVLRQKVSSIPMGRLAQPEEIARAIYFLAIEGTFATGTSMAFDGGTSAA